MNLVSSVSPIKALSQVKSKSKFRIGVLTPLSEQNSSELMCEAFDAACSLGFFVSVLAEGDSAGQTACFNCVEKYPRNFSMLESMGDSRTRIIDESDVVIFPVVPPKAKLLEVITAGVIPILPDGCGLDNFDSKTEAGCAFTFDQGNIWSLVAAIVRASENRKFSWDWKTIKQNLAEVSLS